MSLTCRAPFTGATSGLQQKRACIAPRAQPRSLIVLAASSAAVPLKDQGSWTGVAPGGTPGLAPYKLQSFIKKTILTVADEVLMRIVNAAISTPPVYGAMKLMARQIMISTAEKKGVNWKQTVSELERSEVGARKRNSSLWQMQPMC